MSGLFRTPKPIQMPIPPITPEPEVISEEAKEAEAKKVGKRKGRPETIITGELEPVTTKKTLLG